LGGYDEIVKKNDPQRFYVGGWWGYCIHRFARGIMKAMGIAIVLIHGRKSVLTIINFTEK